MSTSVDSRIVEMRFDNSQFESAVQTSLGTLERLKKALSINSLKEYFSNANRAANNVDLSGIQTSLTSVSDRFSTLGIVGTRVLQNITDLAMRAGYKITNTLLKPLQMIKSGGLTRAMNMQQAEFQFKGLGMDSEKTLAAINKSLQGTPYSLDQAAKVMASLGASGITDPKKIQHITSSIAGTAAMTNSSFADIGSIYTTVASNGRLMTEQLRQLSYRGLNVSATLSKQLGKTETEVQDMVSKGKISFNDFSNAMEQAYGEHATKSTEMYTGALEDLKAALSRIGAKPATQYLNSLRDIFNSLVPVADRVNELLDPAFKKINSWMKLISDSFSAFFEKLGSGGNGFDALDAMFKTLMDNTTTLKPVLFDIKRVFVGVFSAVDIGRQIFSNFLKAVSPLGDIFERIGSIFLDLMGNIADYITAFDKFAKKTDFFGDIGIALKTVLEHVAGVFEVFINKIGDASGALSAADLDGKLEKIYNSASKYKPLYSIMSTIFDGIISCIDKFTSVLRNLLNELKFGDIFKAMSLGVLWKSLKTGNNIMEVFNSIFGDAKNVFKDFKSALQSGFLKNLDELRNVLLSYQGDLRANSLLKIGSAIFLLAYSLRMLSKTAAGDGKTNLAVAVGAVATLMFALVWATKELIGISKQVKKNTEENSKGGGIGGILKTLFYGSFSPETLKLSAMAGAMVGIAVAIGVLSLAISKLAGLKLEDIVKGIGGILVLVGGLVVLSKKVDKTKSQVKAFASFSKSIVVLSVGLNLITIAVSKLGSLKIEEIIQGIGGVLVLIGALIGMSKFVGETQKQLNRFSTFSKSIISLSVGLTIMSFAISKLGGLKTEEIIQGIGGVLVLIGTLVVLSTKVAKIQTQSKAFSSFSKSIVVLSVGLNVMAHAVSKLGSMDPWDLFKGISSILVVVAVLVGLTTEVAKTTKQQEAFSNFSKSIVLMSVGLNLIAKAVSSLGSLDLWSLVKGLGALGAVLLGVYILATKMSTMDETKLLAFAGAMVLVGVGLSLMANAIAKVGGMKIGDIVTGILGLAGALLLFGTITAILGGFIEFIALGALAVLAMAAAIGALGLALSILADGLTALKPIFQGLWDIIKQVAQAIFDFITFIANSSLFQKLTEWLAPDISSDPQFANNYRKLGEKAGDSFAQGVQSKNDKSKQAGKNLANSARPSISFYKDGSGASKSYVGGVTSQNVNAKNAGKKLAESTRSQTTMNLFGLGEASANSWVSGISSKNVETKNKKSGEKISKTIKSSTKVNLYKQGANAGQGLANGLASKTGEVDKASAKLASRIPKKVAKLLDEHSPSRVLFKLGDYATQGFIIGLEEKMDRVSKVSENMAEAATTGPNSLTNILADSLSNIEAYEPTIKPVVDMSNINASASAMNSIFGKDISMSGTLSNISSVGSISRSDIASQEATIESIAEKMAKKMSDSFAEKIGDTNHTFNFNIPFDINGREIAKSIATYTQDELNKMESRSNRQLGLI